MDEIENLPALLEHLPDVTGTPLENNPYLHLIYHMLCSNWAPYRVSMELKRRHGITIPPDVLADFLKQIPESDLLPATSLARHLRENQIIGDIYMELHGLARYSGERLAHWVEMEKQEGRGLSEKVEAALSRHWKRLTELQGIEQELYGTTEQESTEDDADDAPTFAQLLNMGAKKVTLRAAELTVEDGE